jgi:hypothetical protein
MTMWEYDQINLNEDTCMLLGLEAYAQRLLHQGRLGALALLGNQVELPSQRTG